MNKILFIFQVLFIFSCAGVSSSSSMETVDYNNIINTYSGEYIVGVGTGKSPTESVAVQIAKVRALGELSDNIKVTILSELEINTTAITLNKTSQYNESVREQIISIGNATVRIPEYEILNVSKNGNEFQVRVLAKKLISQHIEESSKSLELEDAGELLMKMIITEGNEQKGLR